jgi:inhibitor of KinA
MTQAPRILPAGDQAILLELGAEIDPAINRRVHAWVRRAGHQKIPGIGELIPSYCSVLIYYDPFLLSFSQAAQWVQSLLADEAVGDEVPFVLKEVPVLYGGEFGPDLQFVAQHNTISPEEVIRLHTSQTYLVYVVGFSPGFSAMGVVPPEIQAPRLANPRTKVPAGSVGIGGKQTGIYAVESPGGWQLIGRTPLLLFDLEKDPPSFFQAGDHCRFYAITEREFWDWGKK